MRKTKIVCTIGPACEDKETLKKMILAGMNVARFNLSHGTHASHHAMIENLKKARSELGVPVAIMIDTKGPEIRIKQFEKGSVNLVKGQNFSLTTRNVLGNENGVSVTLPSLTKIVSAGDFILLNDGLIKIKVQEVKGQDVLCKVEVGGTLSNNKSINIPGVSLDVPYLSDVDKADLLFGIDEGADIFAISFVSSAKDVMDVRKFLAKNGCTSAMICSKIESRKGVNNMEEIVDASDSVMVARGDLGVEIEFERIPYVQKKLIALALHEGKNVITATEMLESMIHNIRPTRAEISDVANAVFDSSSAIMLSGETSAGQYPVLSVQTMAKIAESTEATIEYNKPLDFDYSKDISSSIGYASCELARSLGASAIITATTTGYSAKSVSRFRPIMPILACTPNKNVYNQLAVLWGVVPILDNPYPDTDSLLNGTRERALALKLIRHGDTVVQTGSVVTGGTGSDLLYVKKV